MLIHFSLFKYPLTICLDYALQVFVVGSVSDTAQYRSLFSWFKILGCCNICFGGGWGWGGGGVVWGWGGGIGAEGSCKFNDFFEEIAKIWIF